MPDIEKRLEAFVRIGHGIIVFPGGVGTAEEILYLLGILLHPANARHAVPAGLHRPAPSRRRISSRSTASSRLALGDDVPQRYQHHHRRSARSRAPGAQGHRARARATGSTTSDAFYFNWALHIEREFQQPFDADARGDGRA